MKIRHPVLLKMLGFAVACLVRVWISTIRFRYRALGPDVNPNKRGLTGRYIYAFWHENLLLPAYHYSRPDVHVLISQHADGELIAIASRHLRMKLIRGSKTRGGLEAVREIVRLGGRYHIAVTPDGPRGPRREVPLGLVFLAAKTGLPIVAAGVAFHCAWRMNSWDRFAVPRPWSGASCVIAEPIHVPESVDRKDMELYRRRVQDAMNRATEAAERLRA
jgi:lysophospholipid acyltransferase (LPLAT)-like uncharacterized protein